VGSVTIGGDAPVSVQSMTTTPTEDVDATLAQIGRLHDVGCEIVRCATPTRRAAEALETIVEDSPMPVVADVHYDHKLALAAVDAGVHGVRINPGNMRNKEGLREFYRAAASAGIKVRIGVNAGSIRPRDGVEVQEGAGEVEIVGLMVREALNYCEAAEQEGLSRIVLSLKSSDVSTTLGAYRAAASLCDYPFHLGVTEAGPPSVSVIKSSIGIGTLLAEGIGDTIRVSMTGPPEDEIPVAIGILEALRLRAPSGVQIISCPTCARCGIDLGSLVDEVRNRAESIPQGMKVAVMGCVVNGPGEAADADVGIAGGREFGFLFREGRKVRKVPAEELADALLEEIEKLRAEEQEQQPE
jgi:(E)-4-hydroxy-3-methylbut-2-enyl-diphosphate synthase